MIIRAVAVAHESRRAVPPVTPAHDVPIHRGISYTTAFARDVTYHWSKRDRPRMLSSR